MKNLSLILIAALNIVACDVYKNHTEEVMGSGSPSCKGSATIDSKCNPSVFNVVKDIKEKPQEKKEPEPEVMFAKSDRCKKSNDSK